MKKNNFVGDYLASNLFAGILSSTTLHFSKCCSCGVFGSSASRIYTKCSWGLCRGFALETMLSPGKLAAHRMWQKCNILCSRIWSRLQELGSCNLGLIIMPNAINSCKSSIKNKQSIYPLHDTFKKTSSFEVIISEIRIFEIIVIFEVRIIEVRIFEVGIFKIRIFNVIMIFKVGIFVVIIQIFIKTLFKFHRRKYFKYSTLKCTHQTPHTYLPFNCIIFIWVKESSCLRNNDCIIQILISNINSNHMVMTNSICIHMRIQCKLSYSSYRNVSMKSLFTWTWLRVANINSILQKKFTYLNLLFLYNKNLKEMNYFLEWLYYFYDYKWVLT